MLLKMASPHQYIQTSDKEEEYQQHNENEQVQPFQTLSHLNNSSTDEYPEQQLLEVVNEHNETIHMFLNNPIPQVNPEYSVLEVDNNSHPADETYDYEPPEVPDEIFSNSESESSDCPDYILDSSKEEEKELVPEIRIPIKNYPNNTEHEDDFANG